jgi:hypothetical protein
MANGNQYPPPVTTVQVPWLALVLGVDPEFQREKHHELFYTFQSFGRTRHFYADPYQSGAYAPPAIIDEAGGIMYDEAGNQIFQG